MNKSSGSAGGAAYRTSTLALINLLLLVCLLSCELFLSPPHTRENPDDEMAQIASIQAKQIDDNDTYSVELNFMWRDPSDLDEDERIEEVRVVYNIGSPPPLKPADLFEKESTIQEFERDAGTSLYTWTLEQFSPGDEVWFALYPKTDSGWNAPLFEKIDIQESLGSTLTETFITTKDTFLFDRYNDNVTPDPATLSIANPTGDFNERFVVAGYDLPDNTWCKSATLELYDEVTSGEVGYVVPLVSSSYRHSGPSQTWDTLDFENKIEFTFASNTQIIDITKAVNAAMLYTSDAVAIVASEGIASANISVDSLSINYYPSPDIDSIDFNSGYLSLDGSNDYVEADSVNGALNTAATGTVSLEAWLRPDSAAITNDVYFLAFNEGSANLYANGLQVGITGDTNPNGSGFLKIYNPYAGVAITTSQKLTAGTWYHIAVTIDGSQNVSFYVNGALIHQEGYGGAFTPAANGTFSIGQEYDDNDTDGIPEPSNFYSGDIGEIRVWSTARSEIEIADNWNQSLSGDEAGLVAYYQCLDTSSGVLTDSSINGYDGTIIR